jgi:excisionase family DNA binding protein
MNDPLTPARFSILQVCQLTGLGRSALYDRISRGLLRVVKDGHRTFISRAEVERYLKACEAAQ